MVESSLKEFLHEAFHLLCLSIEFRPWLFKLVFFVSRKKQLNPHCQTIIISISMMYTHYVELFVFRMEDQGLLILLLLLLLLGTFYFFVFGNFN